MIHMKKILLLLLLIVAGQVIAEDYPSLLNVEIGKTFAHPNATAYKDVNRPTTQFRIPNYGKTKRIFPEYEIAYLNKSNAVAAVTAETATEYLAQCNKLKENLIQLAQVKFPNYVRTPITQRQLKGLEEYSKEGENTYYVLQCQQSYGPFWYLHFQIRGIKEDLQLKDAWSEFLSKNGR